MIMELFEIVKQMSKSTGKQISVDIVFGEGEIIGVDIWISSTYYAPFDIGEDGLHIAVPTIEEAIKQLKQL